MPARGRPPPWSVHYSCPRSVQRRPATTTAAASMMTMIVVILTMTLHPTTPRCATKYRPSLPIRW